MRKQNKKTTNILSRLIKNYKYIKHFNLEIDMK